MPPLSRTTTNLVGGLVGGLLLLSGLTGCSGSDQAAPEPTPTPSSIGQLDPASMSLVRVAFCDLVPAAAVTAALGGPVASSATWGNGEAPPLDGAGSDLAHENGCSWTGAGRVARAWVFGRPVTAAFARQVIAEDRTRPGCSTETAAGFGQPGAVQVCPVGGRTRVRHQGLFGDTWLTCEITGAGQTTALRARSDAWCAAVANALNTQK